MKENWKSDDWMACWIGFLVILVGAVAVLTGWFDFSALKFSTWTLGEKAAKAAIRAVVRFMGFVVGWSIRFRRMRLPRQGTPTGRQLAG